MDSILGALQTGASDDGTVQSNPADKRTQEMQQQTPGLLNQIMQMNQGQPNMAQQAMQQAQMQTRPSSDWMRLIGG